MKIKYFKIPFLIILAILLFWLIYYFFYLNKVAIYDLVKIEYTGLTQDQSKNIQCYGITPIKKKVLLYKEKDASEIRGCFSLIEIRIPDSIKNKVTSVKIVLENGTFAYRIQDIECINSAQNVSIYILPDDVKSKGSFYKKITSAFPFYGIISFFKKNSSSITIILYILLFVIGLFVILLFLTYLWKIVSEIFQKKSIQNVFKTLQKKEIRLVFLITSFVVLCLWPFILKVNVSYFLIILLYTSLLVKKIRPKKKFFLIFYIQWFFIILLCFELFSYYLNHKKTIVVYNDDNMLIKTDTLLGWRSKANCTRAKTFVVLRKDTLFNYISFDKYGRRVSEENVVNNDSLAKVFTNRKHAIFLGDSYTFGHGLIYNSTFPYIFESLHPEYKSYNYGLTGYGPHQFCFLFDKRINRINNISVPEDSGFCMYTYIDEHLDRVWGGNQYLKFGFSSPDVYIINDSLVLKKRSELKNAFAWFINHSETFEFFNINIEHPKKTSFYKRFADIINYTAALYWNLKPTGQFYIGLYPDKFTIKDTTWIKFLNHKIKVIRIPVPKDYDLKKSSYLIPDGHPSKKLNDYYSKYFSKYIKNSK